MPITDPCQAPQAKHLSPPRLVGPGVSIARRARHRSHHSSPAKCGVLRRMGVPKGGGQSRRRKRRRSSGRSDRQARAVVCAISAADGLIRMTAAIMTAERSSRWPGEGEIARRGLYRMVRGGCQRVMRHQSGPPGRFHHLIKSRSRHRNDHAGTSPRHAGPQDGPGACVRVRGSKPASEPRLSAIALASWRNRPACRPGC